MYAIRSYYDYTIVQTDDFIVIMVEMINDARVIPLRRPEPVPAHVRPWMGISWGRWEGDTLVIETTNLHPQQVFLGVPPSVITSYSIHYTKLYEIRIGCIALSS